MNLLIIHIIFILLLCNNTSKITKKIEFSMPIEKNQNIDYNLIYTEWFMIQVASLNLLSPGKYNFNKFDVTPYDIIEIQKNEINNFYREGKFDLSKIEEWTEYQKKSLCILTLKKSKELDTNDIQDLFNILEEQKNAIKSFIKTK